jgi:CxxC motif-containing protein (DUF1111 family)
MTAPLNTTCLTAVVTLLAFAANAAPEAPVCLAPAPPSFGDPLRGLTNDQLTAFNDGLAQFEQVETVATGLGPVYNNQSCVSCHSSPLPGGGSVILERRYGRTTKGVFDPLTDLGGSLLHQFAIDVRCVEEIPSQANVIARRRTTPLYGFGLIEAIPDLTIQANATRLPRGNVKGRAAMVLDVASGQMRVGRFGWKCQEATLLAFSGEASVDEIGITNRLFPNENPPNGSQTLLAEFDTVADPEDLPDPATGKAGIDRQTDFMRLLAPPPPLPLTRAGQAGQRLFTEIGCAVCHVPVMYTGPSPIAALNAQPAALYSDLLLHDMGSLGDGIAQASAEPREMRTAPLWGLRAVSIFLHDGRAKTINGAIRAHAGEARSSAERYMRLPVVYQEELIQFLKSL